MGTFNGWKRVLDNTTSELEVWSAGQKRLDIGNATLTQVGATSAALLFGHGTATTRATTATADAKFISIYTEDTATSGDSRGIYLRHYIGGAGGGGDALRSYCSVNDVTAATCRGAHISLGFESTGKLTGLGSALTTTLHIPNTATQGGTLCSINAEIWSDGSTSDPAGSSLSVFRVVNGGDATGAADVDTDAVLFDFSGWTPGTGSMIYDHTGTDPANSDGSLKIRLPSGALAYLMYYDQQAA